MHINISLGTIGFVLFAILAGVLLANAVRVFYQNKDPRSVANAILSVVAAAGIGFLACYLFCF